MLPFAFIVLQKKLTFCVWINHWKTKPMNYGQTKDSQVLTGTTYYLGLRRPTIKALNIVEKYD